MAESGMVNARITAVRDVHAGIGSYGRDAAAVCADARREINRLSAGAQQTVVSRQREHRAAMQAREMAERALASCHPRDAAAARAAVDRCRVAEVAARQRLERATSARDALERSLRELSGVVGAAETQTRERVASARQHLAEHARELEHYLTRAAG